MSDSGRPFTKELDIRAGAELVFDRPDFLSDDELIQLVDLVRETLRSKAPADANLPIRSFDRKGDEISVHVGWQVGPLIGGGRFVTVKKTPEGFKAVGGVGMWVS